jgi:DNA topoisomerase-1
MNTFGKCPKCNVGDLKILYSPRTKSKFVGCTHYPNCKNIYSLPRNGLIKKLEERCKECGFYQVLVIRAGKRPWKLCLTPNCKSKEAWAKPFKKQEVSEPGVLIKEEALPKTEVKKEETKKEEIKEQTEKPKKVVKKRISKKKTIKKKKDEAS